MIAATTSRKGILRICLGVLVAAVVVVAGLIGWRLREREIDPSVSDVQANAELVARGAYLARAADCAACHTRPGGKAFGGGVAFTLPFGTLYSTNITADRDTGIGGWSDDDFVRALHQGVGKDGRNLYPAFPYTSYTAMTRDDAVAIKAYLFSLPPVHAPALPNQLTFPFDQRWGLTVWKLMFLDERRFRPDPARNQAQNRGAYLASALGHCDECHTPRNLLMGLNSSKAYAGGEASGWRAYNLTNDHESGLGEWTDAQLQQFLSSGQAEDHGPAAGPMAEVVEDSLRYLTPEDIQAMVVYLRTVPAQRGDLQTGPRVAESAADARGRRLFAQACTGCHLPSGEGRQSPWASLRGDHSARDPSGVNVVQALTHGSRIETSQGPMFMHSFAAGYSDDELAAIGNFVIGQFGLRQGSITPKEVHARRVLATSVSTATAVDP
jgi:mono/diheme cytochrome c family protein